MTTITEVTKQYAGESLRKEVRSASAPAVPTDGDQPQSIDQDSSVHLSSAVKSALNDSGFDEVKVAALRAAIMDGNYPLDPRRVAENMTILERLIG
jgi:negative regulator of flagellin synthesis FlgM